MQNENFTYIDLKSNYLIIFFRSLRSDYLLQTRVALDSCLGAANFPQWDGGFFVKEKVFKKVGFWKKRYKQFNINI